jgi:hypothetical protein
MVVEPDSFGLRQLLAVLFDVRGADLTCSVVTLQITGTDPDPADRP